MFRGVVRIFLACLMVEWGLPARGAETVPLEDALAKIREKEEAQVRQIQNAQWSMKANTGKIPEKGELDALIPDEENPKEFYRNHVIYEPKSGRFRVDQEGVSK